MKICITGDSWGLGEIGLDPITKKRTVLHKGLEEYLKLDGHEVQNFSTGGESNLYSDKGLTSLDLKSYELIFYFQTDPLRDYRENNFEGILKTIDIINDANRKALIAHYERLNLLGHTIYLLGGPCKIDAKYVAPYPNLKILIPSIMEFLCPHLEHPTIWLSDWIKKVNKKNCDKDAFKFIFKQKKLQDRLYNFHEPEINYYFNPNGSHPNRRGHWKIFEKIKQELLV